MNDEFNPTHSYLTLPVEAVEWFPDPALGSFRRDGVGLRYSNKSVGYDKHGVAYTICDCVFQRPDFTRKMWPGSWIVKWDDQKVFVFSAGEFATLFQKDRK